MKEAKIKGWIAREGNFKGYMFDYTNQLIIFEEKPKRLENDGCWDGRFILSQINESFFPEFKNLKWEDEPVEVELTIKRI